MIIKYQIVVFDFSLIGQQYITGLCNAMSLCHEELYITSHAKESADRVCDFVRRQNSCRYLIQQLLEQMEIIPVYQSDLHVLFAKQLCQLHTAKTSSYNHNSRFPVCYEKALPNFKTPP